MAGTDAIAEIRTRCMFPGGCVDRARRDRLCDRHYADQVERFGSGRRVASRGRAPAPPSTAAPRLPKGVSLAGAAAILAAYGWELVARRKDADD